MLGPHLITSVIVMLYYIKYLFLNDFNILSILQMSTSVHQMEGKVPVIKYVPTMVVAHLVAVVKLVTC